MKIDNTIKPTTTASTTRSPTRVAPEKQSAASVSEPVTFSAAAAQLQTETQPPIDRARVQEIKQAIAEGRFKINPEAIADKVLDSARDLLNSQRQA